MMTAGLRACVAARVCVVLALLCGAAHPASAQQTEKIAAQHSPSQTRLPQTSVPFAQPPLALLAPPLSLREQARLADEILAERLQTLLPALMDEAGVDMWLIIAREYNEDPVLRTMLPAEWLSARRRTMLVFWRDRANQRTEYLSVARYGMGALIQPAWDSSKYPEQWDALLALIRERRPEKIAINTSSLFGHADGLAHTDHEELRRRLSADEQMRLVSAESLAIGWLERRTARELMLYPQLIRITHDIIAEGFSDAVITPGITTTDDLVWWFREAIRARGFDTWFHPTVDLQRASPDTPQRSFSERPRGELIQPGDLLHVDIGIRWLGLHSDIQQHAYMLRPGETEMPAALQTAFDRATRVQDLLTGQFALGRSGNQILRAALDAARAEKLQATIYSHPIGLHGHGAGPAIGMWDAQQGVPAGERLLQANTAWSIELNAASELAGWSKPVRIMLEENGWFDGQTFRYLHGRQRAVHLIPRPRAASAQ